jgi:hypothetical protein
MELSQLVPMESGAWRAEDEGQYYDRETIFQYMDGAGEVYLSYDFRGLFVRTFSTGQGEPIYVELFDMGGAADAFGIFTRNRQGGDAGIGQGSEFDSGYLMFWRGRYFCSVYTLDENDESQRAVMEIGRAISASIGKDGPLPKILNLLPEDGRIQGSERYFHLHTCLNHHYYISDDNILALSHDTDAAMAAYDIGEGGYRLLLVRYPTPELASGALNGFISGYLDTAKGEEVGEKAAGKWSGGRTNGKYLLIVLDAPSRRAAETDLDILANRIMEEER